MPLAKDLLHPSPIEEKRKHKLKRLVQHPNSYFMDVKCPGCYKITTVFSHAQSEVVCAGCFTILCQPTGGKARLTEDCKSSDASENLKRQEDEVFVLQSIYNQEEIHLKNTRPPFIGCLKIPVILQTDGFTIHFQINSDDNINIEKSYTVKYLPPIELFFLLTKDYPSTSKPYFIIRCIWLPDDMLYNVCEKLNDIWDNNPGEILFTWASFLREDVYEFLNLRNDVHIVTHRTKESVSTSLTELTNCAESKPENVPGTETLVFENNAVPYKKYLKENTIVELVVDSPEPMSKKKKKKKKKQEQEQLKSSNKAQTGKKKLLLNKNVKPIEYINLNDNIKYVFKGKRTESYKYETEKETKERLESKLYVDVETKKYAITSDTICDLDINISCNLPFTNDDPMCNTDLIDSDNVESEVHNLIVKNENDIYRWLELCNDMQLVCVSHSTDKRIVSADEIESDIKIHSIKQYNLAQFQKSQHSCSICYADKFGSSCMLISPCCHIFCNECMCEYVQVSISTYKIHNLRCPMLECESILIDSQLKKVLNHDIFKRYKELKLKYTLDNHKGLLYCPREVCQNIAFILDIDQETMGHCHQCQYYFCIYCKKAYHGKESCELKGEEKTRIVKEYMKCHNNEKKKELENRFSKKQLEKWVNEALNEQWIRDNGKSCPNCNAIIEKFTGCNKVVCTKCNSPFCWMCGKILNTSEPYNHYSDTKSTCHDKLFFGVNVNDQEYNDIDAANFLHEIDNEEQAQFYDMLMYDLYNLQ